MINVSVSKIVYVISIRWTLLIYTCYMYSILASCFRKFYVDLIYYRNWDGGYLKGCEGGTFFDLILEKGK